MPRNYDAATDGNIVYRLGEANQGNFAIRFTDDLSIRYDRYDPSDDRLFFPKVDPSTGTHVWSGDPLYSAVRIETDADHVGNISLFSSADVTSNGRGISVSHNGKSGALHTEVSGGTFSITSEWSRAFAIHSYRGDLYGTDQEFSGNHDLIVRNVDVDLDGAPGDDIYAFQGGIVGYQGGEGYFNVVVHDTDITIDGHEAIGVFSGHAGTGDFDVDLQKVDIEVRNSRGDDEFSVDGIYGYHLGTGNTNVAVRDVDIEVHGDKWSNGIAYAYWMQDGTGNLSIDASDVNIEVRGQRYLDGIWGIHRGEGDIDVDVHRAAIVTTGADSGGMSFVHDGDGDIVIAARNVKIEVEGDRSVGIGGGQRYQATGDIAINVHDSTVVVTGEQVAGIRSFNFSGDGAISVNVDGGTITAEGPGSSGILVGLTGRIFGERTGPIKAPAGVDVAVDRSGSGDPSGGYRPQNVVVNGRVWGGSILNPEGDSPVVGAGVRLYGGGRVEIGPRGSVGADSGVAVQAEGEGAALYVAFDGSRPTEAIAGEIRNDDGATTIVVNGVVLHDGMTGATGARAPNGARDVYLKTSKTVAGRAFTLTDFVNGPYAPRAAIYEALPGFMLRLDQRGETVGQRLRIPDSPLWIKVAGGQGSYEPDRSHVGAAYDFDHFGTEAGVEFVLSRDQNVTGWASLRHVKGSAQVSAPTGGGTIDAAGFGVSAGASWGNTAGYYVGSSVSMTGYETDLRADGRGLLAEGTAATVRTLGVEAGRRFSLADNLSITPQAWFTRSDIAMDDFRDVVRSPVSLQQTMRSIVGLGVVTETTHSWDGGERTLDLRGRLGVEQVLGDAETAVEVSGERLGSEAVRTRVVLGLGATYHWNRLSLGGEVSASALGSDDNHYTASLSLGTQF